MPSFYLIVTIAIITGFIVLIILSIKNTTNRQPNSNNHQYNLNTSYDFYYVISRFGEDHARDEIIVHARDPFLNEQKMILHKFPTGMVMLIYDRYGLLIEERKKVTVNEAALQFEKMWRKPESSQPVQFEKVKKKKPLVFK